MKKQKSGTSIKRGVSTSMSEEADLEKGVVLTQAEKARRDAVQAPLLMRAYHLPGNNWLQDWSQYMYNNHPVFGICVHDRFHPVKTTARVLSLIGSILFGLAVTNIIYLAFVFTDTDYDTAYVEVSTNATLTGKPAVDGNVSALSVTNGNIVLWTIGAALHATYDNVIWSLAACTCCMSTADREIPEKKMQRYRSTGVFLVMFSVVVVTAIATFAVTLRSALDSGDTEVEEVENYGLNDENVQVWQVDAGTKDYEFILAYMVELGLNYFVYYPVIGTLLFTGMLTCGRFPVVGGRPYELKEEASAKAAEEEGQEVMLAEQASKRLSEKGKKNSSKKKSSSGKF